MAISLGTRSASLGSGRVEFHADRPIVHFGSPTRAAKKRALEDLFGAEVPDSTADRVVMIDHPFVD